jgi:hypothetical protein
MRLKVYEDINKGDVIALDTVKKRIYLARTNDDFLRVMNQGDTLMNSDRDMKKGERIRAEKKQDGKKIEIFLEARQKAQMVADSIPGKTKRESFIRRFNFAKKR